MRRGLGAVLTLLLSACESGEECSIEQEIARDSRGELVDCGTLVPDDPDLVFADARTCVDDALLSGEPFRLIIVSYGIDSESANAFAGYGGSLYQYRYTSGVNGESPVVHQFSCGQLQRIEPCPLEAFRDSACLTCGGLVRVDTCRE